MSRRDYLPISICFVLPLMLALAGVVWAEPPTITGLSPQAVRPGASVELSVTGTQLAGGQLWTSFPAHCETLSVAADGKAATVRVEVPADVPIGRQAARVVTADGVSAMRLVLVDDLPSVARAMANTTPAAAQVLALPTAVDGTIGPLERQYFRFPVEAEGSVTVEVLARRIGSPLDPMLRLFDPSGHEVTYSDDEFGLGGDARLSFTPDAAGEYTLELRDVRYEGGPGHRYRLRIGDLPAVTVPYPLGVQRGQTATVQLIGPPPSAPASVQATAPPDAADWLAVGTSGGDRAAGFVAVSVGDGRELGEQEPNNAADQATTATLGDALNGRFESPGDADQFRLTATKGQKYCFTAQTRGRGAPTDLVLTLSDAAGKPLARVDDTGTEDAVLAATFPADGEYVLRVEDLAGRGGPEFVYRVAVEPDAPDFSLSLDADHLNVPAGGVALVTVTGGRRDYNGPIQVSLDKPPAGVTAEPVLIGAGQTAGVLAVLAVRASGDAARGQVLPLTVVGTGDINGKSVRRRADVLGAVRSAHGNLPHPPPHLGHQFAAAVSAAPPFTLRVEPTLVVLNPQGNATVHVIAERAGTIAGPIELAVVTVPVGGKPAPHLPPQVTATAKPVPADGNEGQLTFAAAEKAPTGKFTTALVGTLKADGKTYTVATPAVSLSIEPKK
jgi:hypothetical protein